MARRPVTPRRLNSCGVSLILWKRAMSPAGEPAETTTRVRFEHPVISAAIVTAIEHLAAFRSMVEAIGKTDGIVYVHEGSCKFRLSACLAIVYSASPVRFVHKKVDLRRPSSAS
jgi:hypothetical protein